jgi:catechol 2,3-dioxygenase-like lactoylglutathione lyase family enzyme
VIFLKIALIRVATGGSSGRSGPLEWKSCLFALTLPALMFLSVPIGSAQVQPETPQLAGIAHAAIRVSDLTRSRNFYESLGFEEAFAMNQGETATESFLKVSDWQFIELYPRRESSEPVGFMHVCFESRDLEGLNRFYLSHGLSPVPVRRARAGNLLFTMQGPEKQNIEYTQYMPGSKHSNDRGMHLGANRISNQIVAVGIEMQDPTAAQTFYEEKLAFKPNPDFDPRHMGLELPGRSGQQVEIVRHAPGSAFQIFFGVSDLQRTAIRLKALHLAVEKHKSTLSISDPDGNRIVFIKGVGISGPFEQNPNPPPLGKQ